MNPNTKKLAVLGAQAFLTGSVCRYVNPVVGFTSLSTASNRFTNNHAIHSSPTSNRIMGSVSTRMFSSVEGLTNVDKQVSSSFRHGSCEQFWTFVSKERKFIAEEMTSHISQSYRKTPIYQYPSFD